jgi:hypothetical protein
MTHNDPNTRSIRIYLISKHIQLRLRLIENNHQNSISTISTNKCQFRIMRVKININKKEKV